MIKGTVEPEVFFEHLYQNDSFCAELGRVILAAGKLENVLKKYLSEHGKSDIKEKGTYGYLIKKLKENGHLNSSAEATLETLKYQRNYLTHNLFDLFSGSVKETILPREQLVEADVYFFIKKAKGTAENMLFVCELITKNIRSGTIDEIFFS